MLKQGIANDTTLREGDPFLGIHGHKTPLRHLPPLCRHIHCIDEAHTLVNSYDEDKESRFVVLCQVLGALSTSSLFLFFLSTAGKVTQFSQPHGQDESDHINCSELVAPHPYITVGFDQLSYLHKFQQGQTIQDITLLCFISHLRRPLYVTSCYVYLRAVMSKIFR